MARMSVTLPADLESLVDTIAEREGISKNEVVRRAFVLLKVAEEERPKGNSLGVIHETGKNQYAVVAKLIGV